MVWSCGAMYLKTGIPYAEHLSIRWSLWTLAKKDDHRDSKHIAKPSHFFEILLYYSWIIIYSWTKWHPWNSIDPKRTSDWGEPIKVNHKWSIAIDAGMLTSRVQWRITAHQQSLCPQLLSPQTFQTPTLSTFIF